MRLVLVLVLLCAAPLLALAESRDANVCSRSVYRASLRGYRRQLRALERTAEKCAADDRECVRGVYEAVLDHKRMVRSFRRSFKESCDLQLDLYSGRVCLSRAFRFFVARMAQRKLVEHHKAARCEIEDKGCVEDHLEEVRYLNRVIRRRNRRCLRDQCRRHHKLAQEHATHAASCRRKAHLTYYGDKKRRHCLMHHDAAAGFRARASECARRGHLKTGQCPPRAVRAAVAALRARIAKHHVHASKCGEDNACVRKHMEAVASLNQQLWRKRRACPHVNID